MRMNRIRALARPCVLILAAVGIVSAQQPSPAESSGAPATPISDASSPSLGKELTALRVLVEKQSGQIDELTKQVMELNRRLGEREHQPPGAAEAPPPAPPPPASANPSPNSGTGAVPPNTSGEIPRAEAVNPAVGIKHTVAKGETLTSIAKRYSVPLPELQKFNKIEDDRKLQIGQVLSIPATATKSSDSANQPKETP